MLFVGGQLLAFCQPKGNDEVGPKYEDGAEWHKSRKFDVYVMWVSLPPAVVQVHNQKAKSKKYKNIGKIPNNAMKDKLSNSNKIS